MRKPIIVVFSRDLQLMTDLPEMLQGPAEIRACDSDEEVRDLVGSVVPHGFVADFRRPSQGGWTEDRLLNLLQQRYPKLPVAMLTEEACPDVLRRRGSEGRVMHLRGRVDRSLIAKAFEEIFETHESTTNLLTTASPDDGAGGLAPGIASRFETGSAPFRQMLLDLEVAARHDVTILLIGETGAGKTYLSRLIHDVSPRRPEPFLPVACGALPNDLIESELFGHVKGAFTSAHADKEGKFLAARRGSLLLDEIDVLGLEQQVKLLRVIETGEFESVGSNQTQRSQARLIVASNLELQPLVEQGKFRPDLYYRLNMLKFVIPPLRHRKVDIVPLARKFVRQFSAKHGVLIRDIEMGLFDALLGYPWPGNVRELEHVMQRCVIYCRDGILRAEHLPPHITGGVAGPTNDPSVNLGAASGATAAQGSRSLNGQIALTEKEIIEQALFKNNFSRTRTAKDLGISRVTLYNKMKRYEIRH